MTNLRANLTIYSREHCHLCHEMIAALRGLQRQYSFDFDVVDVDSAIALKKQYGIRVPVLAAGGEEICHYHLDHAALDAYFVKVR